jgi:hypothetical protein
MPKPSLKDRLQNLFHRALDNAVFDGGNAQGTELPRLAGFRDHFPSRRTRAVLASPQFFPYFGQVYLLPLFPVYARHRFPVDSWCSFAFIPGNR